RRSGLAAGAAILAAGLRDGGRARGGGAGVRHARARGDRILHGAGEPALAPRDGEDRHDARSRGRLRSPGAAGGPSAPAARALSPPVVKLPFDVNDAVLREAFLCHGLVATLAGLTEASAARWGRMGAQQMVEHL